MSLAAHGPRLMTAFLKLKNGESRGAVADLAASHIAPATPDCATMPRW
jgi:hypothetical protein